MQSRRGLAGILIIGVLALILIGIIAALVVVNEGFNKESDTEQEPPTNGTQNQSETSEPPITNASTNTSDDSENLEDLPDTPDINESNQSTPLPPPVLTPTELNESQVTTVIHTNVFTSFNPELTQTSSNPVTFEVSWEAFESATMYRVFRCFASGNCDADYLGETSATTFTEMPPLTVWGERRYQIVGYDAQGTVLGASPIINATAIWIVDPEDPFQQHRWPLLAGDNGTLKTALVIVDFAEFTETGETYDASHVLTDAGVATMQPGLQADLDYYFYDAFTLEGLNDPISEVDVFRTSFTIDSITPAGCPNTYPELMQFADDAMIEENGFNPRDTYNRVIYFIITTPVLMEDGSKCITSYTSSATPSWIYFKLDPSFETGFWDFDGVIAHEFLHVISTNRFGPFASGFGDTQAHPSALKHPDYYYSTPACGQCYNMNTLGVGVCPEEMATCITSHYLFGLRDTMPTSQQMGYRIGTKGDTGVIPKDRVLGITSENLAASGPQLITLAPHDTGEIPAGTDPMVVSLYIDGLPEEKKGNYYLLSYRTVDLENSHDADNRLLNQHVAYDLVTPAFIDVTIHHMNRHQNLPEGSEIGNLLFPDFINDKSRQFIYYQSIGVGDTFKDTANIIGPSGNGIFVKACSDNQIAVAGTQAEADATCL